MKKLGLSIVDARLLHNLLARDKTRWASPTVQAWWERSGPKCKWCRKALPPDGSRRGFTVGYSTCV